MFDLLNQLETRIAGLLSDRLFDDPVGEARAIRILQLGLQPKRYRVEQGQDYPFLILRLQGGGDAPGNSTLKVELIAGLYINPDRDGDGDVDGVDDIITPASDAMRDVVTAFRDLALDGNYFPYSLESMTWQIGDKEGLQPSPDYYHLTAVLVFSQAPIF